MKRLLTVIVWVFCGLNVLATQVEHRTLANLVAQSDHILIGKVNRVDVVDEHGRELTGGKAVTGPGLKNTLRLHLVIKTTDVLKTNKPTVPDRVTIRDWQMWHRDLAGARKYVERRVCIFLLKGDDYQWVYPADYMRDLSERTTIEALIQAGTSQSKVVEPSCGPSDARMAGMPTVIVSLGAGFVVAIAFFFYWRHRRQSPQRTHSLRRQS